MSRINYPPNAPYATSPQTTWYLGRLNWRDIPQDSGDRLITLLGRHEHRPDRLSHDLYGTPAYWWVFAVRNPYLRADPVWSMRAGQQVWAPNPDYLRRVAG